MTNHQAGLAAEETVARHYIAQGCSIAAQRWRGKGGEIDLILRHGDVVIFVEVKKSRSHDRALTRIRPAQARRIMNAAAEFLDGEPRGLLTDTRFDVATVDSTGQVAVLQNAFIDL